MQPPYPESDPKPLQLTPQKIWYWLGIIIIIFGPLWSGKGLYDLLRQPWQHAIEISKSVQDIQVPKPGVYTFYERPKFAMTISSQNQKAFKEAEDTPYAFKVIDSQRNNVEVTQNFRRPWFTLNDSNIESFMGRATITFAQPGEYSVTIIKPPSSTFVLAYGQPSDLYFNVIYYLAFLLTTLILGPLTLLTIYFLRQSNLKLQQNSDYQVAGYRRIIDQTRLFCATLHLGGLFGYVFPMGHLIIPMLAYGVITPKNSLLRTNLNSVMNFQISLSLYFLISIIIIFVSGGLNNFTLFLFSVATLVILILLHITLTLVGIIVSFKDGLFFYPLSIKFLKTTEVDD